MTKWAVFAASSVLAGAMSLAGVRAAGADPTPADVTFAKGRELMKAKKYPEACAAFQQSQQLDPQFGTLYNLAQCQEQIGKLASAWTAFRQLALSDTNADRRASSAAEAKALEPRVPKLVVTVAKPHDGMAVKLDDEPLVVGVGVPIDMGEHEVTATAADGSSFDKSFHVSKESTTTKVEVVFDPGDEVDATDPKVTTVVTGPVDKPPPPPGGSSRLMPKLVTLGGATVTTGGLVLGLFAIHDYHVAQDRHDEELSKKAVLVGNLSTGFVIAGLAATGVGIYLWRRGPHVAVVPASGGASVSVSGSL